MAISPSEITPPTSLKSQFLWWVWEEIPQENAQLLQELQNSKHNTPAAIPESQLYLGILFLSPMGMFGLSLASPPPFFSSFLFLAVS